MRALVVVGADPNALENDYYDIVTIAAVANDVHTLKFPRALSASAKNITSRCDGTALIASAHLGHAEEICIQAFIKLGLIIEHITNFDEVQVIN